MSLNPFIAHLVLSELLPSVSALNDFIALDPQVSGDRGTKCSVMDLQLTAEYTMAG